MAKTKWTKAKKKKGELAKDASPLDPILPVVEEHAVEETGEIDACSENVEERVVRDGEEEKIKDGEDLEEEEKDGEEVDEEEDGDEASDGNEASNEDGDEASDGNEASNEEGDEASDGNEEVDEEEDGDEEEEDVQSIDAMVYEDENEPMQPMEMWFPNSEYGKAMKFGTKCYV